MMSTLDHISDGRFGWNIVTSSEHEAARNFGLEALPDHDRRYATAADMVDTVVHLLASSAWPPDALVRDKSSGEYLDLGRVDFAPVRIGEYFVGGPLNLPRSPQVVPVLVQAGSSAEGIAFAGRYAELVFTVQNDLDEAMAFRGRVHAAAAATNREPRDVKILPGLIPYVGATDGEAQDLFDELQEFVDHRATATMLGGYTGLDFRGYGPDDVIPPIPDPGSAGYHGRYMRLKRLIDEGTNTLRKLQRASVRGHRIVIGSPERIAREMKHWLDAGAVDGYTVAPPMVPSQFDAFVDLVVPELQELGIFHADYDDERRTFRELIGTGGPPRQRFERAAN
jgi:FMN-dependent oxidoreductase (nitrilotriacetate monooxygenase family)